MSGRLMRAARFHGFGIPIRIERGARRVIVGVGMQPPPIDLPQALFALNELSVLGSFGSHAEDLEKVLRLEATGSIDIASSISRRLPLDEVARGLEMLESRVGDPPRIVVEIGA